MRIETARLHLRDFRDGEFETFFATTRDEAYQRYYSPGEMSRDHLLGVFEQILRARQESPRYVYQLAICLPDDQVIGTCGIRKKDPLSSGASFGCAIAKQFWGLGYATEAGEQIIEWSSTCLDIERIFADTLADNERARKLLERLGFTLIGLKQQVKFFRNRWWDDVVYMRQV